MEYKVSRVRPCFPVMATFQSVENSEDTTTFPVFVDYALDNVFFTYPAYNTDENRRAILATLDRKPVEPTPMPDLSFIQDLKAAAYRRAPESRTETE